MTTKLHTKEDQWYFVYTLSYEDKIFYVGLSKSPARRYAEHVNNKTICPVADYIREILNSGNWPLLNIITYQPYNYAESIESTMIILLTSGGQKILNTNLTTNRKLLKASNRKEFLKAIKQDAQSYVDKVNSGMAYYHPRFITPNK
jgi:hypothetical protein